MRTEMPQAQSLTQKREASRGFTGTLGIFSNTRERRALAEKREKGGGARAGEEGKGGTFFDTGVVPQLIACRALTPQVPRWQDSAGHALWTPAALTVVGGGQAQQAARPGHTGVASWRESTEPQHPSVDTRRRRKEHRDPERLTGHHQVKLRMRW